MVEAAHVRSIEALEAFRAKLIVYLQRAGNAVDEVNEEVTRTRLWLQNEGRTRWEGATRRLRRKLEDAQQALMAARMSTLRQSSSSERVAVEKAKRACEHAEQKLLRVKQWNREFDNRVDPLIKELGKFSTVLETDMPRAAAALGGVIKTLDAYAHAERPPTVAEPAGAPPEEEDPT